MLRVLTLLSMYVLGWFSMPPFLLAAIVKDLLEFHYFHRGYEYVCPSTSLDYLLLVTWDQWSSD